MAIASSLVANSSAIAGPQTIAPTIHAPNSKVDGRVIMMLSPMHFRSSETVGFSKLLSYDGVGSKLILFGYDDGAKASPLLRRGRRGRPHHEGRGATRHAAAAAQPTDQRARTRS